MSDSRSTSPFPDGGTGRGGPKTGKPDLYHGERIKLEDWILQMDLFFKFSKPPVKEVDKASLAYTYMRGHAARWMKPYMTRFMDTFNDASEVTDDHELAFLTDWDDFKERIRQVFSIANEGNRAGRVLQHLKQNKSAADYAAEFQHYAIQTEWNDKALMTMFRQGLKHNVKAELMRSGAKIDTLETLYQEAIRVDGDLFELAMETRGNYGKPGYGTATPYFPKPKGPPSNKYSDPYGLQRMELDNLQKGRGRKETTKRKVQHHSKKSITCYSCGKLGHMARDCRSRNKVTRQLNVLEGAGKEPATSADDADDEWEIVTSLVDRLMVDDTDDESEESDHSIDPPPSKRIKFQSNVRPPTPYQKGPSTYGLGSIDERSMPERELTDQEKFDIKQELHLQMYGYGIDDNPVRENFKETRLITPEDRLMALERRNAAKLRHKLRQRAYDNQPNWVDEELQQHKERQGKQTREWQATGKGTKQLQYDLDYRNLNHKRLSWTACIHDHCTIHYSDKAGAGWFPKSSKTCRCQWFDCPQIECPMHLWDKRSRPWFPGKEDPAELMQMNMLVNGRCTQDHWQTCLNENCERHWELKKIHGYGKEAFLGNRPAPGIDPKSIVLQPIQQQ